VKLIISEFAENDLRDIYNYIKADNLAAAVKMADVFEESFDKLAAMPRMGVKKTDLTSRDVLFYIIKKRYFIVYTTQNDTLQILRVLATHQDIGSLL
jgi:plasmid stabilization system protein ParE